MYRKKGQSTAWYPTSTAAPTANRDLRKSLNLTPTPSSTRKRHQLIAIDSNWDETISNTLCMKVAATYCILMCTSTFQILRSNVVKISLIQWFEKNRCEKGTTKANLTWMPEISRVKNEKEEIRNSCGHEMWRDVPHTTYIWRTETCTYGCGCARSESHAGVAS